MKKHLIIVSIISAVAAAALGYFFFTTNLLPNPSSKERYSMDPVLQFIFGTSAIIFAIVVVFLIYILFVFRRRRGDESDGLPVKGNRRLEFGWIFIPFLVVISFATYGGAVLQRITTVAPESQRLNVSVTAMRYAWSFEYHDASITTFELVLPVNQEVYFTMRSKDVVHSFWIAELGPKQDIVPGIATNLRLTPTKIGNYEIVCSQLCGDGHSYMTAPVRVVSQDDYGAWVQAQQLLQIQKMQQTSSPSSAIPPMP